MEKEFAQYLPKIIPSLFNQAALQPKVGVEGNSGDILEFISELKVTEDSKTLSVKTDQMEDKNRAIQMLSGFVDDLEDAFAEYIQPTSELFVSMVDYEPSDSIRNSIANSLPPMLKCLQKAYPDDR